MLPFIFSLYSTAHNALLIHVEWYSSLAGHPVLFACAIGLISVGIASALRLALEQS